MTLLIVSFLAGVLTIAAPCILPLLPVIVGGSIVRGGVKTTQWYRPLVITGSLVASVIIFSLLLKASTALLDIPYMVWQVIAGGIVLLFGINLLFPALWEQFMVATRLNIVANKPLATANKKQGIVGDILLGGALGPIFSSCSPTYALIVATILPASFGEGLLYLAAYSAGLGATLLLIAYVGQQLTTKMQWLSNPNGWLRKIVGVIFIIVGLVVVTGFDKHIQAFVLAQGWYDPISQLERWLRP